MREVRFDVIGPDDGFELALRRQGWHLTGYKPVHADPNVIRPMPAAPWNDRDGTLASFYDVFGDNTARKLLRAAFTRPRTRSELERICPDIPKIDSTLRFLEWCSILAKDGEIWSKGAACAGVDNTGSILEWYVAEWFRHELKSPARHGVTLREVPRGGDLDVIAFDNDIRVFVECKTGKPESITESNIRWFLQRAHEFNPEIALLLIDTESTITGPVGLAAAVVSEMGWLESHREATEVPPEIRQRTGSIEAPPGYNQLYCCAPNVYLSGVPESIDASLSAVLRLYFSYVRHQVISPIPLEWDFVEGKVHGQPGQPFGVEGQVRFGW